VRNPASEQASEQEIEREGGGGERESRVTYLTSQPPFSHLSTYPAPICPRSKVYRGLGSMLLPHEFWVPHGNPPWRGGVERALMSTTADKAVALHYANGKGTVVEIDVGRIQTGGDVCFLSMVPPPPVLLLCATPLPLASALHLFPVNTRLLHTLLPPMPLLASRTARFGTRTALDGRGAVGWGCGCGVGGVYLAVPRGKRDHVSALHLPGVSRRPPLGAGRQG
jgi:hypothetical protein